MSEVDGTVGYGHGSASTSIIENPGGAPSNFSQYWDGSRKAIPAVTLQ